jgi:hypothetical protein
VAIDISGTVYSDAGVTTMAADRTVAVSVNGAAAAGTTTTGGDGTYSIAGITADAAAVLTLYIQDGVNPEVAVTVTRSTGSNMAGVDLYADHLILRNDQGTALLRSNLNTADNNGATGITALYSGASNVTVASGKHVLIPAGHAYTLATSEVLTLTAGNLTVAGTLTRGTSSTVTLSAGGLSLSGTLAGTGLCTLNVFGDFSNTGTVASGASLTLNLRGTGGQTFRSGGASFQTVTVNASGGTYTLADAATVTGTLTITLGTLDVSGSNHAISAGSWSNTGGTFNARSGTVTTTGTTALRANTSPFYDLVIDSAGIQQSTDVTAVTHALTINAGKELRLGAGHGLDLTGATFTNRGTLRIIGDETLTAFTNDTANGGTVLYVGSGTNTYASLLAGNSYANLTFNGTGRTWQLGGGNPTVSGNLTITAGTLEGGARTVSVGGNWANAGTFTAGTSNVTLTDADHTISGSTTFNNLTCTVAAARTLTFTAGTTTTVSGTLTLQGASGQLLSLRSSSSPSTWTINATGATTLEYLSVEDSTATTPLTAGTGSVEGAGGGNTGWTFPGGGALPGRMMLTGAG